MVEAPNGKIYIGTAYNGLVYELNPDSGEIRDLGSPPVDSTPWIFTMIRTRAGEIYGAKGVGLFHLDWRTGHMESCGTVPGRHESPLSSSAPIIRTLEERPDGILWGDTNRWIFTFDPATRQITPVADVAAMDDACYAIIHGTGSTPVPDLHFQVYARFSGQTPRHRFFVCRAATGAIEPLQLEGLEGFCWINGWWLDGSAARWLITHLAPGETSATIAVVDVERQEVIERWAVPGNYRRPARLAGSDEWFISPVRGTLYRAEPQRKHLVAVATNPVPVECRCLAATIVPDSSATRLGTDTYDCGFVFTRDVETAEFTDHGPVWIDDHRCNYGPASFGGAGGEYFLANHGEAEEISALWVTELSTNRHWRIGNSAIQLVRLRDGSVWGTQGPNPPAIDFDPIDCWTPAWHARPGVLFSYDAGAAQIETLPELGLSGPIAEAPDYPGGLLLGTGSTLRLYDRANRRVTGEHPLPSPASAAATDYRRRVAYLVLRDGAICVCTASAEGKLKVEQYHVGFCSVERGCFVLPHSGRLAGIGADGTVTIFDPDTAIVTQTAGPVPLPSGPAVDPIADAWYFADRYVVRYSLGG